MATITQYPDGIAVAGPDINRIFHYPIAYEPSVFRNEDGGADVNVQPCGILKIELVYEVISAADLTSLRTHFNLAKGRVNDFSFYSRYLDVTYTGVRYERFEVGRQAREWVKYARVTLVKFL